MIFDEHTRITDQTVEQLLQLIRGAIREELRNQNSPVPHSQAALLELEPLHVGAWPEGLTLLSREDYYDDER